MTVMQGDLQLLDDPVAQELLGSQELARLAYSWLDGTPRVVPMGFHWNGAEKSWDCPCHGSRFAPDGHVVNGPAREALKRIEG